MCQVMTRHDPRDDLTEDEDERGRQTKNATEVPIPEKQKTFESVNKFRLLENSEVEDAEGDAELPAADVSEASVGISVSVIEFDPPDQDPEWSRPVRKHARAQNAQMAPRFRNVENCGCGVSFPPVQN